MDSSSFNWLILFLDDRLGKAVLEDIIPAIAMLRNSSYDMRLKTSFRPDIPWLGVVPEEFSIRDIDQSDLAFDALMKRYVIFYFHYL